MDKANENSPKEMYEEYCRREARTAILAELIRKAEAVEIDEPLKTYFTDLVEARIEALADRGRDLPLQEVFEEFSLINLFFEKFAHGDLVDYAIANMELSEKQMNFLKYQYDLYKSNTVYILGLLGSS